MISQLQQTYLLLNQRLFQGTLPAVSFVPCIKQKQVFNFKPPKTVEIGIACLDITFEQFFDELAHVMVHIHNWHQNIHDVTKNQYHKLQFCTTALSTGLFVARHPTHGWGTTSFNVLPGHKVRQPSLEANNKLKAIYAEAEICPENLLQFQNSFREILNRKAQKQFQFRYVCQCDPPFIVRVGKKPDGSRPLRAKCLYCHGEFELS